MRTLPKSPRATRRRIRILTQRIATDRLDFTTEARMRTMCDREELALILQKGAIK